MRKWKDADVIKVKHNKLLMILSSLTVALAGFDVISSVIYHKLLFTSYDLASLPVGIFGIWCFGFGGLYKVSRYVTNLHLKRKDNKFRYFHT